MMKGKYVSSVCNKENTYGVVTHDTDKYHEYGSGWQAAAKQASYVMEQEAKSQLQAKTAEVRGNKAISEEWWLAQRKVEDHIDLLKTRKNALELEKERAAWIASLPPPKTKVVEKCPGKQNSATERGTYVILTEPLVPKSNDSPMVNACEKAAIVAEQQRKSDEQKMEFIAKHNTTAEERFQAALNMQRLKKEYAVTVQELKQAQKLYRQKNPQVSQIPSGKTMCPPVDKRIRQEKLQKMANGASEIATAKQKSKEHVIEDLIGYKDQLEENFLAMKNGKSKQESSSSLPSFSSLARTESFEAKYYQSRERSLDIVPSGDVLNQAYIESPIALNDITSVDQPFPRTSSPKKSFQAAKRDFGIQVDESMFPVTKGVQVDLLTSPKRLSNSISKPEVEEIDKHRRSASVGIQTEPVLIIEDPVLVCGSSISSSSYQSLPSKHGIPFFPDLFLCQRKMEIQSDVSPCKSEVSGNYISSSTSSKLPLKKKKAIKKASSKQSKYFPPILDSEAATSSKVSDYLQKLAENSHSNEEVDYTVENETVPMQAMPLSAPIHKPPSPTKPFVSWTDETSQRVEKEKEAPIIDSDPTLDNMEVLNTVMKAVYNRISNQKRSLLVPKKTSISNKKVELCQNLTPAIADIIITDKKSKETEDVSFPTESQIFPEDLPDMSQSFFDVRKEELPSVSMLANLSEVELSQDSRVGLNDSKLSSSDLITSDTKNEINKDFSQESAAPNRTRSAKNIENLNMIRQIIHKQLKQMHHSLEQGSLIQSDSDSVFDLSLNPKQQIRWAQNGKPYVYHELSTIEELDSALIDSTRKSLDEDKVRPDSLRLFCDSISKSSSEKIDTTPTSLVTELSDVSHVLEGVKIIPRASSFPQLALSDKETSNVSCTNVNAELIKNSKQLPEIFVNDLITNAKEEKGTDNLVLDSVNLQDHDALSLVSTTSVKTCAIPVSTSSRISKSDSPSRAAHLQHKAPNLSKTADEWKSPAYTTESGSSIYSSERDRILDSIKRNFSIVPPPSFPSSTIPFSSLKIGENEAISSPSTNETCQSTSSDVLQINIDLSKGSLSLKSFNGSEASTVSTNISGVSVSTVDKDLKKSKSSPVPLSKSSHAVTELSSSPGTFYPLTLISDVPSAFMTPNLHTDRQETPTLHSRQAFQNNALPLIIPSLSVQRSDNSPTSDISAAPKQCSKDILPYSPETDSWKPNATSVPKKEIPRITVDELKTPTVQKKNLLDISSISGSVLQKFKTGYTPYKSLGVLAPTSTLSSPLPAASYQTAFSGESFQPLTFLDIPGSTIPTPSNKRKAYSSSSSSNASDSLKTVLHHAMNRAKRVNEFLRDPDMSKNFQRPVTPTGYNSSSDESLSRMFTGSKIAHQSTPIKSGPLPLEQEKSAESEEVTLIPSQTNTSYDSIENARRCASPKKGNLLKQGFSETAITKVETIIERQSKVSIVVQKNQGENSTVSEAMMSQSMMSFLQHEMSTAASSDEHVSLLVNDKPTLCCSRPEVKTPVSTSILVPTMSILSRKHLSSSQRSVAKEETPAVRCIQAPTTSSLPVELPTSCLKTPDCNVSSRSCPSSALKGHTESTTPSYSTSSNKKGSSTDYKIRTKRLWNNLEEVKARREMEMKKEAIVQNKEKVKKLQQKLQKKRKAQATKRK